MEKSGHGVVATTFLMIFLAEFGDKTQFAVAGLGAAEPPFPVWLGATLALITTSAIGIWVGKALVVNLKYGPNRERSLAGLRRVSKPGLRVYAKSTNLPRVLGGLGVAIISTSSGLLTDRQAARQGVGGEVLAYVW